MKNQLSLEERIKRIEAVHEIQNLMSKYEYYHTAGRHQETADMFALNTPGVRAEIANWGVYEGKEGVQRVMVGVHSDADKEPRGFLHIHTLTTPVIEVARDCKTAKGIWISPGIETTITEDKKTSNWAWEKYGVDFVVENGEWKFWHFHAVFGFFYTPYHKSWIENTDKPDWYNVASLLPPELKPDRPSTHPIWLYNPTAVTELVPIPPEPYETWDEATAYVP